MRPDKLKSVCVLALLLLAASAPAQQPSVGYTPGGYSAGPTYQPYYGGSGWGGYGFSPGIGSTVAGSYLGGLGEAIRAQGQYNALSAEAAVNLEEAKKREIENRVRWTNAYFEMRKMNKAFVESQRAPRWTQEQWVRAAHEAATPRLPASQLDPVTGQIHWPTALRNPDFNAEREKLDKLFAERASTHGAMGVDLHSQIRQTIDATLARLKDRIRDFQTGVYLEARNFLTSLARESDFPAG